MLTHFLNLGPEVCIKELIHIKYSEQMLSRTSRVTSSVICNIFRQDFFFVTFFIESAENPSSIGKGAKECKKKFVMIPKLNLSCNLLYLP